MNALIVIDVQNDFMKNGSLPVEGADSLLPALNDLMPKFDLVVATKDWHPPKHCSFVSSHRNAVVGDQVRLPTGTIQKLWPEHCIRNTWGASFPESLNHSFFDYIVHKGTSVGTDSYSGFQDNCRFKRTDLEKILITHNVSKVFLAGLILEYCVRSTAIDSLDRGFETTLIIDVIRSNEDECETVQELVSAGATLSSSQSFINSL